MAFTFTPNQVWQLQDFCVIWMPLAFLFKREGTLFPCPPWPTSQRCLLAYSRNVFSLQNCTMLWVVPRNDGWCCTSSPSSTVSTGSWGSWDSSKVFMILCEWLVVTNANWGGGESQGSSIHILPHPFQRRGVEHRSILHDCCVWQFLQCQSFHA